MIDEIVNSYALSLNYLRRMVADVPDELLTRQSGAAVNHPAWVIGHLVHSCQALGGEMGMSPWLPANWGETFGTGSVPSEGRKRYPPKAELLEALADGQRRLVNRLAQLGDAGMAAPLPDEKYRGTFPTVGHAVLHILTVHAAIHVGQITLWRRAVGLGPMSEFFD